MMSFQPVQPIAKEMKNQKEIARHQRGIHRQFDGKSAQTLGSFLFHGQR